MEIKTSGKSGTESPKLPGRTNPSRKLYDVFISYSHRDGDWVENEFMPRLKVTGLKIALDLNVLQPGQSLEVLQEALEASRVLVPVFTPSYFASDFAPRELERAIQLSEKQEMAVLPILLRGGLEKIPSRFKGVQYYDLSMYSTKIPSNEFEKSIAHFIDAVTAAVKSQLDHEAQVRKSIQTQSASIKKKQKSSTTKKTSDKSADPSLESTEQAKQSSPQPQEKVEVKGRALADTYSEQDLLGYEVCVQALTDFIESSETKKPITIGIDAPWGGGKTTIMHMLQKRLGPPKKLRLWQKEIDKGKIEGSWAILWGNIKARASDKWHVFITPKLWRWPWQKTKRSYFYTVWFNAWKYDQEESLWAALVLEILEQVRQQLGIGRKLGLSIKLNWQRFKLEDFLLDLLKSFLTALVIALIGAVVAVGIAIASGDTIQNLLSKAYVIGRAKVIVGLGIVSLVPLTYTIIKDVLGKIVSPFSLGISKYFKQPDYKSKIGFFGQFQEDFKSVVETVTEKGRWPLLIFVDDLDRCTANKAAAVIESINLLLDSEHCVFIIGMDSHILASSIQAKYKDLQDFFRDPDNPAGLSLGHKFLEKIIQIDFRVPTPDPKHVYDFIDINLGRSPTLPPPQPQVNEPQRLIQAEQRTGKSLEEAKIAVQQSNPEIATQLEQAVEEIKARSFDDNDEVQQTVRDAAPFLDYNPRKIKRYINLYRLQSLIAYRRGVLEDTVSLDILGKWILISLRWHEFFDEALEHPIFVKNFFDLATNLKKANTPEKRKAVLDNITEGLLNQDRIKLLLDNQDIVQLIASIPHSEDDVKNYLQLVQLSSSSSADEK